MTKRAAILLDGELVRPDPWSAIGEAGAAEYLGVSTDMLKQWRENGGGPRSGIGVKNRAMYRFSWLNAFIAEREMRKAIQKMTNS